MNDTSHLQALEMRLSNERMRLAASKSESESKSRKFIVSQIEKEIAGEYKFLGITKSVSEIDDDALLKELFQS